MHFLLAIKKMVNLLCKLLLLLRQSYLLKRNFQVEVSLLQILSAMSAEELSSRISEKISNGRGTKNLSFHNHFGNILFIIKLGMLHCSMIN